MILPHRFHLAVGTLVAPPSLASLTREKPGDSKRRLFSLSQSVLAGLELAMASVAETASWLDWWLSTVSGFSEAQLRETPRFRFESNRLRREPDSPSTDQSAPLPPRRAIGGGQVHGAGGRTCTPPPFPDPDASSAEIFPSTRLDTAISKARAASNDPLVHKALPPPPESQNDLPKAMDGRTQHTGQKTLQEGLH